MEKRYEGADMKIKKDSNFLNNLFPYSIIILLLVFTLATLSFQPLWFDEQLTMNESNASSISALLTLVLRHESIPPLFFLIEYFLVHTFSLSAFVLRLIPALAGVIGCLFYWKIFQKITDRKTAILSLILCVTSAFLLIFSQEARVYAILFCESMLMIWLSLKWLDHRNRSSVVGILLLGLLSLNTHYYALFMNVALLFSLFIIDKERVNHKRTYTLLISGFFISILSILPWFLPQLALQTNGQKTDLISKAVVAIPFIPLSTLAGPGLQKITSLHDFGGTNAIVLIALAFIFLLAIIAVIPAIKRGALRNMSRKQLFLVLFFVVAFLQHIVTGFKVPSLHPRYTIYSMMLLFGGLLAVTVSKKWIQNTIFGLLLSINLFGLFTYFGGTAVLFRVPWDKIAIDISSTATADEVIISADLMHVFSLPYYLQNEIPIALFDGNTFWRGDAPIYQQKAYPFFNTKVQIYQKNFEFYQENDTMKELFISFLHKYPNGFYLYQEDGKPYNENFLQHHINGLRLNIFKHYNTNQGIVYLVRWEYQS